MIKEINECVGCDIPCINCGRKHVERLFCDTCDLDIEFGYRFEGEDYCPACLIELIKKRYFDTKETAENFLNFLYQDCPWLREEPNFEEASYEELLNLIDEADLDKAISYLGIAARPIKW